MTITTRPATPGDLPALRAAIAGAVARGEFPGHLPEDIERWEISMREKPALTLVAGVDGAIAGLMTVETSDLLVEPSYRRRGIGRALVAEALRQRPDLSLYPPAHNDEIHAFCRAVGMVHRYTWHEMRLDPATPVAPAALPAGVHVRPYRLDEAPVYLDLLLDSFADHPTPMHANLELLLRVQSRPEFDPSLLGMLVADDAPDRPLGFCRCVLVPRADTAPQGDIRTLGVARAARRHGYGRQLLRWGIAALRAQGAGVITLGVEASNDKALGLYIGEGFVSIAQHPAYALPAS